MSVRACIPVAASILLLAACMDRPAAALASQERVAAQAATHALPGDVARRAPAGTQAAEDLPAMVVHKSPTCGCCALWIDHVRAAGFKVEVRDTDDLEPVKQRLGVPFGKGSCHTAEVGGLVVEGHVPAGDIKRLLALDDGARGLVLPGMPIGSPGMETPDGRVSRYVVERVNADGSTEPFAVHGQ